MNTRTLRVLVLIGVVAGSFSVGVATAATVLDQDSPSTNATFSAANLWQQEVVVGVTGLLTRVDLHPDGVGTTPFFINAGVPWQTDASDFATVLTAAGPGWITVDTSAAGLVFNAGDHFMIGLGRSEDGLWLGGSHSLPSDAYPAGQLWMNDALFNDGGWDIAFRTYVDDTPVVSVPGAAVPLPGAVVLGLLGFGTVARLRKRL